MGAIASRTAIVAMLLSAEAFADPGVDATSHAELGAYYDSDNVAVLTPAIEASVRDVSAGWSARGNYLVDIVSAASVDIVSTASPRWSEVRHAATLGAQYQPGALGVSLAGATSVEPDYVSMAGTIAGTHEFARKNLTLSLEYTYEHDVAGRTGTPFSVYSLSVDRHAVRTEIEIVVGRATTLTPALDATLESGRQEKPYRWLPLFDESVAPTVPVGASIDQVNELRLPARVAERVPKTRHRYAGSARLAHRFAHSTLVLWDRAYIDSWGLAASTTDLYWVLELSRRWSFWPLARFHTQSGVSFWQRAYVGSVSSGMVIVPEYRSGDRELGPLWSAALGSGVGWDFGAIDPTSLRVSLELRGIYTDFRNALYIDHRWAGFGVAGFTARFE